MEIRFAQGTDRLELTPVDNRFIAEYMPEAKGLYVQVYLYGLMQCYYTSMRDVSIAKALDISEAAAEDAYAYWQEKGLVRIVAADPLTVEYLPIGASPAGGATAMKYAGLVSSLNALTAPRQFGMNELKHVYEWIELYGLAEDAVLMLVSHCLEMKGKNCPTGYMTAVAETWAQANVHTGEQAIAYIKDGDVRNHGANMILKAWHLRRPPTSDEMERYDKWIKDWGFSIEAIKAALPRLSKTAAPSFDKLDSILEELYLSGKTDAQPILNEDEQTRARITFAKDVFEMAGKPGMPTQVQANQIAMFEEKGMLRDLILYAAELARGKDEPFGYIKKLLCSWEENNIRTRDAAEKEALGRITAKSDVNEKKHSIYSNKELEVFEVDLTGKDGSL